MAYKCALIALYLVAVSVARATDSVCNDDTYDTDLNAVAAEYFPKRFYARASGRVSYMILRSTYGEFYIRRAKDRQGYGTPMVSLSMYQIKERIRLDLEAQLNLFGSVHDKLQQIPFARATHIGDCDKVLAQLGNCVTLTSAQRVRVADISPEAQRAFVQGAFCRMMRQSQSSVDGVYEAMEQKYHAEG